MKAKPIAATGAAAVQLGGLVDVRRLGEGPYRGRRDGRIHPTAAAPPTRP
ncbi:hypothetical protein ACFVFI_19055 [Streptomyces sp. NPDC057705]